MIRTVVEFYAHVDHLIAGDRACLHSLDDTLFDRRNVFLRDGAADDVVDEFEAFARLTRIDADLDVSVLTVSAGLLRVLVIDVSCAGDSLFIRYLRLADIRFDLELSEESVDDDLQMEFAHARDDRLACVRVRVRLERRVFLRQLRERDAHLFLAYLSLRLDGDLDNRIREYHRFQDDRVVLVAERVAGGHVFKSNSRSDVARIDLFDLVALIRVHLQDPSEPAVFALCRVIHVRSGVDRSGVDSEEREFSDVRVCHDLKRKSRERFIVG